MKFKKNKIICQDDSDKDFCDFIIGKEPEDPFEARDPQIFAFNYVNWIQIFNTTLPLYYQDSDFPTRMRITQGIFKQRILFNKDDIILTGVKIR